MAQGLREHGYVERQNLDIERRFSEGKADRLPVLAAELMRAGVRLMIASGPAPSIAAKGATATIPVVVVGVAEPRRIGPCRQPCARRWQRHRLDKH